MNAYKQQPSPSVAPDLDWSQVSETVRMLDLAIAQIRMAMHEGDDSVDSLTTSFTQMVASVNRIAEVVQDAARENDPPGEVILRECAGVRTGMQHSIVAFQFYDRLSQRLEHVRDALGELGQLVSEPARLYSPTEWHRLQQQIRTRYSLSGEQRMFDALLNGATVEQALREAGDDGRSPDDAGVELF